MQNLPHEHEEVVQSPVAQGVTDGGFPFAFAQRVTLYVRMRRVVICGCGSSISSNDLVGPRFVQPMPVQHDLKTAEVDAFENHVVRRHRNHMPLHVHADLVELRDKQFQIAQYVPDSRQWPNRRN